MSRSEPKKKTGASKPKKAKGSPPLDPLRAGMPAMDSITGVDEVGKGKKVFRIIHTNEADAYDQIPPKPKQKKRS
jgi:hypothetical protein